MPAVLGIDAAWVERNPSGVALIRENAGGVWEFVAVAPSYAAFIGIANGQEVRWDITPTGGAPEPGRLLGAAENLLDGERVTVVAVDMPLSNIPITRLRCADAAINREFRSRWCGVYTPTPTNPGRCPRNFAETLIIAAIPLRSTTRGDLSLRQLLRCIRTRLCCVCWNSITDCPTR